MSVVAALLAFAAVSGDPEPKARDFTSMRPAISMKRTGGWGPVAIAVVRLEPSKDVADGYYCPGPEDADSICLGAKMFYRQGWVTKLVAASPDFGTARGGRFKVIGSHSQGSFLNRDTRVVLLERTDDGYVWVPWDVDFDGKSICIPADIISKFAISWPSAAKSNDGDSCLAVH